MKNRSLRLVCAFVFLMAGFIEIDAQVKIGSNPTVINPSSLLELESANKGLLLPRVPLDSTTAFAPLASHVAGMVVYNTDSSGTGATGVTPGYYYNDGTRWVRLAAAGNAWQLSGNAGTTAGANLVGSVVDGNYLGTTDAQNLVLATNGTKRLILDTLGNAVGGLGSYLDLDNTFGWANGNFVWGANDTVTDVGGSNGYNNVVFGFLNKSTAANSSIFGFNNKDLNYVQDEGYNFVAGNQNLIWDSTSSGASGNTVMGLLNRINSGSNNTILGDQNSITFNHVSFAIGSKNTVNADTAYALGYNNVVNHDRSLAVGSGAGTTARGQFSANFDGGYRLLGIAHAGATDSLVTDSAGYIRHRTVASLTDNAWKITGNAGTTAPTGVGTAVGSANYWGTSDAQNLAVGTNGTARMMFDTLGNAYGGKNNIIANGGTQDLDNGGYPATSFMWGIDNVDSSYTNAVFGTKNKIGGNLHSNIIAGEKDTITGGWGWGNAVFGVQNFVTAQNGGGNVVGGIENRRVGTNVSSGNGGALFGYRNVDSSYFSSVVSGSFSTLGQGAGSSLVVGLNDTIATPGFLGWGQGIAHSNAVLGEFNKILSSTSAQSANANIVTGSHNKLTDISSSAVFGTFNQDSASYSFAAGQEHVMAPGAQWSGAVGRDNYLNAGFSFAVGSHQRDSAGHSFVSGSENTLTPNANFGTATGAFNTLSANAGFVTGSGNNNAGNMSIVGGNVNTVTAAGGLSIVAGWNNRLAGGSSAVFGRDNKDSATYSLVAGYGNTVGPAAIGSVVFGGASSVFTANSNISNQPNELIAGAGNISYPGSATGGSGYNAIFGGKNTMGSATSANRVGANMIGGWSNTINAGVEEFIFAQQCSILSQPGFGGTGDFVTGFGNHITNIGGSTASGGYGMNGVFGAYNTVTSNNTNYGTFTNFVYGQHNTVRGYGNLVGGGSNGGNTITAGSENVVLFGRNSVINNAAADVLVAGTALISVNNSETVLGAYNQPIANTLFAVGNGKDNVNRSNAITVLRTDTVTGGATANSSTLNVNGSVSMNIVTVASTYTVLPTDYTIIFAGQTAAFTCTLPNPTTCKGRILTFCNYGTQPVVGNNTVTLSTPAGNLKFRTATTSTVQTATTYPLGNGVHGSGAGTPTGSGISYTWKMTFQSNGTDWYVIGNEP